MISFMMGGTEYRVFDHLYAVSRGGQFLRNLQPYAPTKHPGGYLSVGRGRLAHRVVAACWLEDFDPKKQVHHKNECKTDNRAENLECVTASVHIRDRHHGIGGRYVRTEETRQKLRDFRTGRKDATETRGVKAAILLAVCPKTPCVFQGKPYPSVAAGARAAGVPSATFRQRCGSKNFPDYGL